MVSVCVFAANESWVQMDDTAKSVWQRKAIAAIRKHEMAMRKVRSVSIFIGRFQGKWLIQLHAPPPYNFQEKPFGAS